MARRPHPVAARLLQLYLVDGPRYWAGSRFAGLQLRKPLRIYGQAHQSDRRNGRRSDPGRGWRWPRAVGARMTSGTLPTSRYHTCTPFHPEGAISRRRDTTAVNIAELPPTI